MWKEIRKIVLKALVDVRIRVDGEKVNINAGDLIEVDERNLRFYFANWFGYENDEIKKVEKKENKKGDKKVEKKETTEIVDDPEEVKKEQAEKAKAELENEDSTLDQIADSENNQ